MAFSRSFANQPAQSDNVLQIIKALEGDTNLGQPIKLVSLSDAGNFALDVRNLGAGGALRVRDTAGAILLQVEDAKLTLGPAITRIIPGATSFSIRDSSNTFDNLLIAAGTANVSIRGAFSMTSPASTVSVGGTAVALDGLRVLSTLSGSTTQAGAYIGPSYGTDATTLTRGILVDRLAPSPFSVVDSRGIEVSDPGVFMTVSGINAGVYVRSQTKGAQNFGVYVQAPSGGATQNAGIYVLGGGAIVGGEPTIGVASTVSITGTSDVTANSSGVGTILFKGASSRNSAGFIKVFIGTVAHYIPCFTAITG